MICLSFTAVSLEMPRLRTRMDESIFGKSLLNQMASRWRLQPQNGNLGLGCPREGTRLPEEVHPQRLSWKRVRQLVELAISAIGPIARLIDAISRIH
jgi:hypothetical protein